jgi:hypothetical protein
LLFESLPVGKRRGDPVERPPNIYKFYQIPFSRSLEFQAIRKGQQDRKINPLEEIKS